MNEFIHITFASSEHSKEAVYNALEKSTGLRSSSIKYLYQNYLIVIKYDETDYHNIISCLGALGIAPSVRREIEYDKEDLLQAPLLWLSVTTAPRGDPQRYATFDSTGCPRCGTGSKQIGPLRMSSKVFPAHRSVGQTLTGEVVISQELFDVLTNSIGPTNALRQVIAHSTCETLPWWQICPDYILPSLASSTTGIVKEGACSVCNRDGHFHSGAVPFKPVYLVDQINNYSYSDYAATYECFGNSGIPDNIIGERYVAQPLIFISNRVMRIMLDCKVRGIKFTPATIIN